MKITIYTTTDCQFSKAEKEYLSSHSLSFEEKNLEKNKDYLTEMLSVSNNFAGTPVTKIEKDDGTSTVLKGFTKDEFDQALNFAPAQATPVQTASTPPSDKPVDEPQAPTPTPPSSIPTIPEPTPPTPPVVEPPPPAPPPLCAPPPPRTPRREPPRRSAVSS